MLRLSRAPRLKLGLLLLLLYTHPLAAKNRKEASANMVEVFRPMSPIQRREGFWQFSEPNGSLEVVWMGGALNCLRRLDVSITATLNSFFSLQLLMCWTAPMSCACVISYSFSLGIFFFILLINPILCFSTITVLSM